MRVGFFAGHSIASIWVGLRAEAAKAQVSALYLFFYYAGGSVTGTVAGWVFAVLKWPGVGCLCRRNVRPCAPDRDQASARSPDGASQPEAEKAAR